MTVEGECDALHPHIRDVLLEICEHRTELFLFPRRRETTVSQAVIYEEVKKSLETGVWFGELTIRKLDDRWWERMPPPEITKPPRRKQPRVIPPRREPPPPVEKTWFSAQFVDESGIWIDGLSVTIKVGGTSHALTTDKAGVVELKQQTASIAIVSVADIPQAEKILVDRLDKLDKAGAPTGGDVVGYPVEEPAKTVVLSAATPRTIVLGLRMEQTWFEVRVVDELGEGLPDTEVEFSVNGAVVATDANGVARLEDRFRQASGASFTRVRITNPAGLRERLKPRWDSVRTPKDYLAPDADTTVVHLHGDELPGVDLKSEHRRTLSIQPYVVQARLFGMYFDTDKCFLLPSALPTIQKLRHLYDENPNTQLLVVGHADARGQDAYNETLSLERAKATLAYLKDDVDAWLDWYGLGKPDKKRWDEDEDRMMIRSLQDRAGLNTPADDPVLWFQQWHNGLSPEQYANNWQSLEEDGKSGPATRRQLIGDYMNHDETSLPSSVMAKAHGCGEYFTLSDTDPAKSVEEDAAEADRRVELFFFDGELGVQPPPPGTTSKRGSKEYPEWKRRASKVHDFYQRLGTLRLFLHDYLRKRMPGVEYELRLPGDIRRDKTNAVGYLVEEGIALPCEGEVLWAPRTERPAPDPDQDPLELWKIPEPQYRYRAALSLFLHENTDEAKHAQSSIRLKNLGYTSEDFDACWSRFQQDYGMTPHRPWFDQSVYDELRRVHREGIEAETEPETEHPPEFDDDRWEEDDYDVQPSSLALRLHDHEGQPMNKVRYRISLGGGQEAMSPDGWVLADVGDDTCVSCRLEWGQPDVGYPHPYSIDVVLNCRDETVGQAGSAFFSSNLETYVEVRKSGSTIIDDRIYLWAYNRRRNGPLGDGSRLPGPIYRP